MKVVFRADASFAIGTGHVMRCLTLADALRQRGADISFVCRENPGSLISLIVGKGYPVVRLPLPVFECNIAPDGIEDTVRLAASTWLQDADDTIEALKTQPDWLIIDNYALDHQWERALRPYVGKIMVIDDLAGCNHDCDLLLDQNLFINMETRYDGLLSEHCKKFLGPKYAILRPEFIETRKNMLKRDGNIRRILVFFGGSDPTNETAKTLEALYLINRPDIAVDVVVGETNPHRSDIKDRCASMPNTVYYCQITNMAEVMANTDLAIGAGGTATWERCFLGLPSLVIVVADNQLIPAQAADNAGLTHLIGKSSDITSASLALDIRKMLGQPDALTRMTNSCLNFMGRRNTPVSDEILTCLCELNHAA